MAAEGRAPQVGQIAICGAACFIGVARGMRGAGRAQLSSSAVMVYSAAEVSQRTVRTLGLQQTWQSSTYCWREPPDSSTVVSIHSKQPAHW